MQFKDIVMNRYATKLFDGKELPEEKVHELLELIRFSASSFNIQPWKIKIIKDKETKEALFGASYNQPQVTSCSHLLVFCADTNIMPLIDKLEKHLKGAMSPDKLKPYMEMMRGFAGSMNEQQTLSWSQRQVYLALGNALNGAKSLGFDSCPMEGFSPAEYSKVLKLPGNIVPAAICAIGHAADKAHPKMRFSKEEILI
ncbi:MAG: NAD(P)H-dependent oxidoreductase [Candidatus Micrarchaeota archaeon]